MNKILGRAYLKIVILLTAILFVNLDLHAQEENATEKANGEEEKQEWTRERVDSLVKSIREYFDELLDVELGWAALQARHLSNVGYGIDNYFGLNRELRDTLEFLRNVFESELFVKSMLKYDHFWPNLINRKQYSPKPNELEKQHDGLYAQSLYFDIVFYPSWDTVAMDVDAAREAGKIGYKCTIAVNGLGQFEADLDGDEMSRILNELITGKEYTKIKQQAGPDVNESMMAGLGWLAEKFDYRPFDDPTNIKRVDFYAPVSQNYGYDAYENAILSGNYDNVSIKGKQYHVPWKSVAVQKPESVVAIVRLKERDKPAGAKLKFITTTGQEAQQATRADDTTYHVVLPPVTSEGEFGLLATYSYKNEEDKEITVNAGQANISGYTTNPKKVVIVPVNGNKAGLTATGLKKALDEIYKQAATTWNVEIYTGNLQVKSVYADDGKLDDGKPGLLSNYTEEMSEIIKTFKDRPGVHIDKNTCYLFLVDKAKSGPGKCGFMPLKRPFGFIFTDSRCSNNISHTIAHELGHGPFRLYHTFSSENEYKQGKGTTDNLMDYMTSTEKLGKNKALYKYQWDLIHDPEAMIALFQDKEEGELETIMVFDENANVGGMIDFIEYIIKHNNAFEYFKEEMIYNQIDNVNAIDESLSLTLLENILDNKIQVDIAAEAVYIIRSVYMYWMQEEVLNNQQAFIDFLEGFEEDAETSGIIASFLSFQTYKFATNGLFLEKLTEYSNAYYASKIDAIKVKSLSEVKECVFKISSNQRFKSMLRDVLGVTDGNELKRIMDLKRTGNLDDFLTRNGEFLLQNKNKLSKYISINELVENTVEQNRYIASSLKRSNFFRIVGESAPLLDAAMFFVRLYQGKESAISLSATITTALVVSEMGSWVGATIGTAAIAALAIIFELEVARIANSMELRVDELWSWRHLNTNDKNSIVDWKQSNLYSEKYNSTDLLIQYVDELGKYNFKAPTSIRVLDAQIAKQIFGFIPKFVNYDFPQEGNFNPRYYVPYETTTSY